MMSWRPGAKSCAKRYVCAYLISWFLLIVWFHQSLKWCKLVCSFQILSESRRVIRIEALTMMTPRPGTGSGWRCATSSGYWHHHQVIAMGGYSALMVMVPQWYCIHLYIHPYTTTSVSSVQLWHVAIAAWHLRTIVMCCYNLREAPSMEEWELRWQIMNNFLLLLLLFHPNRNV